MKILTMDEMKEQLFDIGLTLAKNNSTQAEVKFEKDGIIMIVKCKIDFENKTNEVKNEI